MIYQSFLSGLLSVLTPGVFLSLFIAIPVFISVFRNPKSYLKLLFTTGVILVILFYAFAIISHNQNESLDTKLNLVSDLKNIAFYLLVLSVLGLSKIFKNICSEQLNNIVELTSSILALLSLAIIIFLKSISALGPIIGSVLVNPKDENVLLEPMVAFSIGIYIPFLILGIFLFYLISILKNKISFERVQVICSLLSFAVLSYVIFLT